jgi:hypothetical protein
MAQSNWSGWLLASTNMNLWVSALKINENRHKSLDYQFSEMQIVSQTLEFEYCFGNAISAQFSIKSIQQNNSYPEQMHAAVG